jgi:hypothetical protein
MKKLLPLIVLVLINLIIGLIVLPGFGESTDELSQNSYADRTIHAVRDLIRTGEFPASFFEEQPKQGIHGPAFIVIVNLLKNLFLADGTEQERLYLNHYLYFLVFLVGTVSLYFLARRWMSEMAAMGTVLLFNTQPLFVGHAFMNPKDVVFMSLLIASAALGFWMMESNGQQIQPRGKLLLDGVRSFLRQFLRLDVWLAGLCLGLTSAIRIAGPLVGLIILICILIFRKWQSLPRFFAYGVIAFCSMIVFWPYLWPDPFGRLLQALAISAAYPDVHLTLYKGVIYDAPDIPRSYLPVLLMVQLTETTLLLAVAGIWSMRKRFRRDLVTLTTVWFILPAAIIVLLRVNLYNNFRQFLFILPPLFLLAGLGLDWLFTSFQRPVGRVVILFLAMLPGLYANVALHPYQYVYYNQLVDGVRGAYRVFELDYWNLAFRECQEYVNQHADKNANVYVGETKSNILAFARPDLIFNAFGGRTRDAMKYDYLIVSTAKNGDLKFGEFPIVFVVERAGVPLAYILQPTFGIPTGRSRGE